MRFYVDAWSAIAPGLDSPESWCHWLSEPDDLSNRQIDISLKSIPPMIRRRFRVLGKSAVGAALPLVEDGESIPSIFSSRHGDTSLTISVLEDIAREAPISPTSFSLAVHNAISGLFSIARKDTSAITSLAPMDHLVFHTLCEAIGQLQSTEKLLCVIYDAPLPEFFRFYEAGDDFPYAVAMIISCSGTQAFELTSGDTPDKKFNFAEKEALSLVRLLTGLTDCFNLGPECAGWRLSRQ